jgi:hypothetical protein
MKEALGILAVGVLVVILPFLGYLFLASAHAKHAPLADSLECVGGCLCNDKGGCKCFNRAHDDQCRCQGRTCKDEDK